MLLRDTASPIDRSTYLIEIGIAAMINDSGKLCTWAPHVHAMCGCAIRLCVNDVASTETPLTSLLTGSSTHVGSDMHEMFTQ